MSKWPCKICFSRRWSSITSTKRHSCWTREVAPHIFCRYSRHLILRPTRTSRRVQARRRKGNPESRQLSKIQASEKQFYKVYDVYVVFLTLAQKHIFVNFLGYGDRFSDTFVGSLLPLGNRSWTGIYTYVHFNQIVRSTLVEAGGRGRGISYSVDWACLAQND